MTKIEWTFESGSETWAAKTSLISEVAAPVGRRAAILTGSATDCACLLDLRPEVATGLACRR